MARRAWRCSCGRRRPRRRFNDFGEQAFYGSLVQPLVNRLQVEDWYTRHPEIEEQDVAIELLGVGFPRTGSTALSHLLAEDPAFRNLRLWEETDPVPAARGVAGGRRGPHRRRPRWWSNLGRDHMLARLRSMLPQSATGPMEDHDLMALEFTAQTFLVGAHIPTYADWFANCDMEPTYRYEKRVFKLLQWKTPEKRVAAEEPDAHHVPRGVREGVPRGPLRADAPRRLEGAPVGVGPLLHDAPGAGTPPSTRSYVGDAQHGAVGHRARPVPRVPGRPGA